MSRWEENIMQRKGLLKNRILALGLSAALVFSCVPTNILAADAITAATMENTNKVLDESTAFTFGSAASLVDNREGKALKISKSWLSGASTGIGITASAAFKDASIFKKDEFTLYMDVYRQVLEYSDANSKDSQNKGSSVAFSVGTADNYFKICLSNGGSLRYGKLDDKGNAKDTVVAFTNGTTVENKWNAVAVSYSEKNGNGMVSVYIEGQKVLEQTDIGFALSELTDIQANIGGGFGTGFMVRGLYDDIRIEDTAITSDTIEIANRYTSYSSFSGAQDGILCSGDVNVNEWLDTNGEHIQAHGGQVQWLDTLDLDEDGKAEGGWIWYGEDKTRNGKPIDGIHCYTSSDLYNWTDRGIVLSTHDVIPDKINSDGTYIEQNTEALAQLKIWADMEEATEEVLQNDIDMAKAFLEAYRTENGYDEENLAKAFKYLYSGYCIAERPKMLYNEHTKQYVLIYHVDGPSDENILKYLKDGTFPSRYTRAMMGFAVADTPYGPFKLVNAQRLNYRTGDAYASATSQGMARDMTVFKDDTDINKDGVKDAYAIYSSEDNKYMYVSLLNADYTAPITEGTEDTITLADGSEIQTFADRVFGSDTWREAPAVFKYNGYYYMITSGTTGWMANPAGYYRADNIYGPYESMGDPCEGGSADTFGSQPTAVIPVDVERGKFIYMGDRWSYTITDASAGSSGTDSAHWDSGYVWLPIEINENNTIVIPKVSNWDLSILDKVKINTEMPKVISSVEDLPTKLNVTVDAGTFDSEVEWDVIETEYFTEKRITGTLKNIDNRTFSVTVKMAPKNIVYFVDAGASSTIERDTYIEDSSILKNKTTADQAYNIVNKWGHVGNNTMTRSNAGEKIYEMLRYVNSSDNRNLVYQFDGLEKGDYSVYVGLYEPSSWYSATRIANISVKQGNAILAESQERYGAKGDAGRYVIYENIALNGTDSVQVILEPKNIGNNTDVQISFIAIVDNSIKKEETDNNDENQTGGNGEQTEGNGSQTGGNGEQAGGNGSQTGGSGSQTGGSGEQTGGNGEQTGGNGDQTGGNEEQTGGNGDQTTGGSENQIGGNGDQTIGESGNQTEGNGNQTVENENQVPATKITLNAKKLYMVKGSSIKVKAVMSPAKTTDILTWNSSKKSIATVADGKIKAKKVGNTNITVTTTSGKKATCKVYVVKKAKKSNSVKLNKKKVSMKAGNWILLTPTLKPAKSTDTIKWKSSNKKVASVDAYGFVTAKKKGKATITATTKSGKKVKCKVTVK